VPGLRRKVGKRAAYSPLGRLNFIIDAQLPRRLAMWLGEQGHGCIHTKDLPLQNRTTDSQILRTAQEQDRCVITKAQ
jgi:predicted nuclease of predicted toxin-antitoxin system